MLNMIVLFGFLALMNQLILTLSSALTGVDLRELAEYSTMYSIWMFMVLIFVDIGLINTLSYYSNKKDDDLEEEK